MKAFLTRHSLRTAVVLGGISLIMACSRVPDSVTAVSPAERRIVCASPAVTEIVYALGCGDRIVGVSEHTTYPPEAATRPCVGGWMSPNRETLLSLEPDIIIGQGKNRKLADFSRTHGIAMLAVRLDSLADVFSAIRLIAEELGEPVRGAQLVERLSARLNALRASWTPGSEKRVALLLGRESGNLKGLTAVGSDTFLSELLRVAGGINIFADAHGLYPQVSRESLLVRRPQFVIELHPGVASAESIAAAEADWARWSQLMAVTNGGIVCVTNDFLLIPGPRMVQTVQIFADLLHKEKGTVR